MRASLVGTLAGGGVPTSFDVALSASGSTITVNVDSFGANKGNLIRGSRTPDGSFTTNGFQANGTGQWIEIAFNATRTINEINFISANINNLDNSGPPTLATDGGFTSDNTLEMFYWSGAWVSLGSFANSLQWKQWLFAGVVTTKIRMEAAAVAGGALYALAMEAWGY